MIEVIVLTRVIVDYFWEYKAASVIHSFLSFTLVLLFVIQRPIRVKRFFVTDAIFASFIACCLMAYAFSPSNIALTELSKFLAYLAFYVIGRIWPTNIRYRGAVGMFAIMSILYFLFLAVTGYGYISWGSITTFSGGYFFKTDLAISVLLLLSLVFSVYSDRKILLFAFLGSSLLVFLSNSRIALPLVAIIPTYIALAKARKIQTLSYRTVMYAVSIVSISLVVFSFVDFRSFGLLGLDFGNFLSESNTQGRSVIWNALLASYSDSGIFRQLFGSGLDSDVIATALFSDNLRFEDKRAHNSFLYLLLSTGFVGFLLFHCLVIRSWSKVLSLYKDGTDTDVFIANVASALFFMYLWLSLTVEVIIRPQVMVLLFLFLGMVERRSSKVSMQGNPPGN